MKPTQSRTALALLASLVASGGCEGAGLESSEWDVYDAVLAVPPPRLASPGTPLFARETVLPEDGVPGSWLRAYLRDTDQALPDELLDSLVTANRHPIRLEPTRLSTGQNRLLASDVDVAFSANRGQGWRSIEQRYGADAEILELSRPGFSVSGDTAVVHLTHSCGPQMCSSGEYLVFAFDDGAWTLVARTDVWVW